MKYERIVYYCGCRLLTREEVRRVGNNQLDEK